jgi:hypothetical protein
MCAGNPAICTPIDGEVIPAYLDSPINLIVVAPLVSVLPACLSVSVSILDVFSLVISTRIQKVWYSRSI